MTSTAKNYSHYFDSRQLKVIEQIGDIYCPSNSPLPSFSELGAIEHIDLVIADLPEGDRKDLGLLLVVLSFCPRFFLVGLVALLEKAGGFPRFLAMPFLLLRFGLRGIVFSLYYSGLKGERYSGRLPTEVIGFQPKLVRNNSGPAPGM